MWFAGISTATSLSSVRCSPRSIFTPFLMPMKATMSLFWASVLRYQKLAAAPSRPRTMATISPFMPFMVFLSPVDGRCGRSLAEPGCGRSLTVHCCGRSLTEPRRQPKVSRPMVRPSVARFGGVGRPSPNLSCGRSLTEPRRQPTVSRPMGRPSVVRFGGVGRPSPNLVGRPSPNLNLGPSPNLARLCLSWFSSLQLTLHYQPGPPALGIGPKADIDRQGLMWPVSDLMWPVSDRATPHLEAGVPARADLLPAGRDLPTVIGEPPVVEPAGQIAVVCRKSGNCLAAGAPSTLGAGSQPGDVRPAGAGSRPRTAIARPPCRHTETSTKSRRSAAAGTATPQITTRYVVSSRLVPAEVGWAGTMSGTMSGTMYSWSWSWSARPVPSALVPGPTARVPISTGWPWPHR